MTTIFETKSMFLHNVSACLGGDPVKIAEWLVINKFTTILPKCVDGIAEFTVGGRPNVSQAFVDTMRSYGLKVIGWGFNYGYQGDLEGLIAQKVCDRLGLDGWTFDMEGRLEDFSDSVARAGQIVGTFKKNIKRAVPLAFCSWAFYWNRTTKSQIHEPETAKFMMDFCDVIMPMVYWSKIDLNGKPVQMTNSEVMNYLQDSIEQNEKITAKPIVPVLRAYTGDAGFANAENIRAAGLFSRLNLTGMSFWFLDHASDVVKFPGISAALSSIPGYDVPAPIPGTSAPELLEVRANGQLVPEILTAKIRLAETIYDLFIDQRVDTPPDVPPVPERIPAIPGPFELKSHREAGEGWFWPDAQLDAYPAAIASRGGEGTANFQYLWLSALRLIMTLAQWLRTWVDQEGWHNSGSVPNDTKKKPPEFPDTGTVKQVEFSHNLKWVTGINPDGWYEYDVYYLTDPPPNLSNPIDKYRRGIMTVDYKTGHEDTGGVINSDLLLPYISIARSRSEKLRIDPKYMKPLKYLPFGCKVKTDGTQLNVRDIPSTGQVITTFPNNTPITIFELRKIGNGVWGRVTAQGSIPGWCAMWFTDAGV